MLSQEPHKRKMEEALVKQPRIIQKQRSLSELRQKIEYFTTAILEPIPLDNQNISSETLQKNRFLCLAMLGEALTYLEGRENIDQEAHFFIDCKNFIFKDDLYPPLLRQTTEQESKDLEQEIKLKFNVDFIEGNYIVKVHALKDKMQTLAGKGDYDTVKRRISTELEHFFVDQPEVFKKKLLWLIEKLQFNVKCLKDCVDAFAFGKHQYISSLEQMLPIMRNIYIRAMQLYRYNVSKLWSNVFILLEQALYSNACKQLSIQIKEIIDITKQQYDDKSKDILDPMMAQTECSWIAYTFYEKISDYNITFILHLTDYFQLLYKQIEAVSVSVNTKQEEKLKPLSPLSLHTTSSIDNSAKSLSKLSEEKKEEYRLMFKITKYDTTIDGKPKPIIDAESITECYYIASIDNLESMLKYGLLSHKRSQKFRNTDLSNQSVQDQREKKILERVEAKKKPLGLHRHVNLYLNPHNAMMLNVVYGTQDKMLKPTSPEKLCLLCVHKNILNRGDIIITDKNAAASDANFFSKQRYQLKYPSEISMKNYAKLGFLFLADKKAFGGKINDEWVYSKTGSYKNDSNKSAFDTCRKQSRQAEVLAPYKIDSTFISRIIVNSEESKKTVTSILQASGKTNLSIIINSQFFMPKQLQSTLDEYQPPIDEEKQELDLKLPDSSSSEDEGDPIQLKR
jgi:hypothetical protein